MKNLEVFNFKGDMHFSSDITLNGSLPLGKEVDQRVDFIPLFDDTLVQDLVGYEMAKVLIQSRKEPDKNLLKQTTESKLGENFTEEEFEAKLLEVRRDLIQFTGIKEITCFIIIDNRTGKLVVANTSTQSNIADDIFSTLRDSLEGSFKDVELFKYEAPIVEKLLTDFLLDESKNLPDPLMLVEKVSLGDKSEFEKTPKGPTIKINKEYPADDETLAFIHNRYKVVKMLQLDFDGVVEFCFNFKGEINALKFKEGLKYKLDEDAPDSLNFMSEFTPQLPVVFDIINKLEEQLEGVEY